MNSINRLEESWTPQWDLGLQDEFGFFSEEPKENAAKSEAGSGWGYATREVLNRQNTLNWRVDSGASSVRDLIAFFESLSTTEDSDHE